MNCTLVILTKQALLGSSHPKAEQEDMHRCYSANLEGPQSLQDDVYPETSAVTASPTPPTAPRSSSYKESDQYLCCIKFFWDVLWEFQQGCNRGLKRPLRIFRSLMARMDRVTLALGLEKEDELLPEDWPDKSSKTYGLRTPQVTVANG
ncbi:hypothetical protein LRP88_05631 [Fusarium phalaenopsidis]